MRHGIVYHYPVTIPVTPQLTRHAHKTLRGGTLENKMLTKHELAFAMSHAKSGEGGEQNNDQIKSTRFPQGKILHTEKIITKKKSHENVSKS